MQLYKILEKLKSESQKSDLQSKHACVAFKNGKVITPFFHNYMRTYIYDFKCGSAHAEMSTINYIINTLWCERLCKKQKCIL